MSSHQNKQPDNVLGDGSRQQPAGQLPSLRGKHQHDLRHVDLDALLFELAERLERGESPAGCEQLLHAADSVVERLGSLIDVHGNRFSMQRISDLFWVLHRRIPEPRPSIVGETYLDLGCGSVNPFGFSMLMCLLGAERCVAVDLAPIQDPQRAIRFLARLAGDLLRDPQRVVFELPFTRDQIAANLARFDVKALQRGDPAGLGSRIEFRREPADALSLDAGSVSVVVSNSFLEHVADVHAVLAELWRVTKNGGFGIHSIDVRDHWSYAQADLHPLDFLRRAAGGMVNESNRIRLHEFPALFEQHGFVVQAQLPGARVQLTDQDIATFAAPWAQMPRELLEQIQGAVVVRKV